MKHALKLSLLFAIATGACGDASPDTESAPGTEATPSEETPQPPEPTDEPIGTVSIVEPAEGTEVEGPSVEVSLEVSGFPVVEAGDMTPGTGHHHLYLDADLTPADQPVPTVEGSIIHMGEGGSTYTFENVEPGEHRLIAVVADGAHFPVQPWVVDTVTFQVR